MRASECAAETLVGEKPRGRIEDALASGFGGLSSPDVFCNRSLRRDLFDSVRAGAAALGQCSKDGHDAQYYGLLSIDK